MAQAKLSITGGLPDSTYTFIVREEFESTGDRYLSYNPVSGVLIFDEIQDGQLHNYKVTIQSPGCLSATKIIPFQCTDTGACETVRGGQLTGAAQALINQPLSLAVTSLSGTTPYQYTWSTTGGVLSSTSGSSVTITFGQVGSYTVTVSIQNCGNSPITLTKTIQAVLETCEKQNNTCYFYGLDGDAPYLSFADAQKDACTLGATFVQGSFTNGLNLGSTAFATIESGVCRKLSPGYYAVRNSTNGCVSDAAAGNLINSIIQIDITGKIIGVQPFSCDVTFDVSSIQQPLCTGNTLTAASVMITGIQNANRYILCQGDTFTCSPLAETGTINGAQTVVSVPAPLSGQSQIYTLRLYTAGNTSKYLDKNVIITSPSGCLAKSPAPVITNADYHSITGGPSYTTTFRGTKECSGTIKLYKYNTGTSNYDLIMTQNLGESGLWEITPLVQYINGPGEVFTATLTCPEYGAESDISNIIVSKAAN